MLTVAQNTRPSSHMREGLGTRLYLERSNLAWTPDPTCKEGSGE